MGNPGRITASSVQKRRQRELTCPSSATEQQEAEVKTCFCLGVSRQFSLPASKLVCTFSFSPLRIKFKKKKKKDFSEKLNYSATIWSMEKPLLPGVETLQE